MRPPLSTRLVRVVFYGAALAPFGCSRSEPPAAALSSPSASARRLPATAAVVSTLHVPREPDALRAEFVGSAACAPCHASQATAYAKSHHALALVPPTPAMVHAKFDGTSFTTPLGGTTRFASKDGAYTVTSPNSDDKPQTFAVSYVAGVHPLQQFIVPTEHGKLQTLSASWDTRPAKDGGQRWFHLYGQHGIAHDDELFFTRAAQNWNHTCADCHSTLVERRYDVAKDAFDTRWAELSVGCEACHGPGAAHVKAARAGDKSAPYATLTVKLTLSAPWSPSATGSPTPRAVDDTELEVCAPCHSRRDPLREGFVAGDPFLDAFEPELLRPGLYHADGQVEGEVYEWASFLQSKMHASGVRCSDCHDPHSGERYAQGNALCTRCHAPSRFDVPAHSHHEGASAPGCVDCHMPKHTFMQVDERSDHSIRIPRPDSSAAVDSPNACNACHTKNQAAWAAAKLHDWFPDAKPRQHFGTALARERQGALDAREALDALARDTTAPAIARATALEALGHFPSPHTLETLRDALRSSDALVVYGAALGASALPAAARAPLLVSVLEHPRRAVRVVTGRALAGLRISDVPPAVRASFAAALSEADTAFALSASRPGTHVEKSAFELARGNAAQAQTELETALRLAPCLVAAHLNLADLARARGDELGAEREIRAALRCEPKNAFAEHALGLWQVRNGKRHEAVASLRKAVELAPDDARFCYVLAVATADDGDMAGAVKVLGASLERHPNDPVALQALAGYLRKLDREELAADAERRLEALLHD